MRGVRWTRLLMAAAMMAALPGIALAGEASPPGVQWAEGDVKAALQAAGVAWEQARISAEIAADKGLKPEGFDLAVAGDGVKITGADASGAMYGLLELAEQIRNGGARGDWKKVVATLAATRQEPYIEYRADNPFCHAAPRKDDKDHPPLSFNDLEMWKAYIDMLARSRFNMLDIHGAYSFGPMFPNLYPHLVHVPEYPQVGRKEQQDQALADFKTVVAYAKERGIRVGIMSYEISAGGLSKDALADYTAKAIARICKEVPDLYAIGFRIGESGGGGAFFEKAYLQEDLKCRLYTRTWGASPKTIETIGKSRNGELDIEIKYNGEEFGLPYQAAKQIYGYEGYVRQNTPYRIIWQIRASGTHRFWAWENTDFIRRTIPTFRLGGAVSRGFSLEPHIAYTTTRPRLWYKDSKDQEVHRYTWERYWAWYFAWGRLSYNPELPEATVIASFKGRFGDAGETIYKAMQESGRIVPLVLTSNSQHIDHSHYLPELEPGCFKLDIRTMLPKEGDRAKFDPLLFGKWPRFLDTRSYAGSSQFVTAKIQGKTDGRVGPAWAAKILSDSARNTRELIAKVGPLEGRAAGEWRLLKTDLTAAADLGDYYSERTLGVMHLDYALQTGSQADYDKALGYLKRSREAWKVLSDNAEAVYAPLYETIRVPKGYRWSQQLPWLEELDAMVPGLWEKVKANPGAKPLEVTPAEAGADAGIRVDQIAHSLANVEVKKTKACMATIGCRAVADKKIESVVLWYKPLSPCDAPWKSAAMKSAGGDAFAAEAPIGAGKDEAGLMYSFEVRDAAGQIRLFPDPLRETPYRVIELEEVAKAGQP